MTTMTLKPNLDKIWSRLNRKKPELKFTTVELNFNRIRVLHEQLHATPLTSWEWLLDVPTVIKGIHKHTNSLNGQAAKVSSIASVTPALGGKFESCSVIYREISYRLRKQVQKHRGKNIGQLVKWSEIQAFRTIYPFGSIEKAIVELYGGMPPRRPRAFGELKLSDGSDTDLQYNWLDCEHGTITLNTYKTFNMFGQVVLQLPCEVLEALEEYVCKQSLSHGSWVFNKPNGDHYENMSSLISRVFKGITSNMIRHSAVTNFIKTDPNMNEKTKFAFLMGQGVLQQGFYQILKSPDDSSDTSPDEEEKKED
jgi:hypothetical protein